MDARVHGMGNGLSVRSAVGILPVRVLFIRVAGVGQADLDELLAGKGKLPLKWADSLHDAIDVEDSMKVSENGASSVGEGLGLLGRCDGTCREKIDALEATRDRVAKMVEMLVEAGGLASLAAGMAVEKPKGKMAREWDELVSQALERAKAEAVVKVAEKQMRTKAEEEKRAEEARVQQEKVVQVKEAASLAVTTQRDRMVEAPRGCTDGPAMVAPGK